MCCGELPPSPLATRLPWKPCCRIARSQLVPSIGLNSGKKSPEKHKPAAAENELFAALPPGTIRVDGPAICAHLSGLPITPCFRVRKIDNRSFRGSVAGLDFAYCDFYQRNPRTHLVDNPANSSARAPIATPQQSMRLSFHE